MEHGGIARRVGFGRRAGTVALVVAAGGGVLVSSPGRVGAQSFARAAMLPSPESGGSAGGSLTAPTALRSGRSRQSPIPEIDLDHVVVRFKPRRVTPAAQLAHEGARISRAVAGTSWTELSTPNHGARRVRAALLDDPSVAQVSFSYIRHALTVPNDPQWIKKQSSYLAPLRLDRAWDISKGVGVTVAVVDTGADLGHPDLAGQFVGGYNVLRPGAQPQDDNGHGTLVSGVIAARTNNGRGVVGVSPGAKVMPIKVLDSNGAGSDADIATGIDWARTHNAKVVNLSLGGAADDPMLSDAIQNAIAANVVVVAAAGNDAAETVEFPAAYPGVIAVSATTHDGALTSFSSFGWRVDVAAPGLDITSTALGGAESYTAESGTSFSSPIVAGVAALIRSQHPAWTQLQVADQIRNTARDAGVPGVDPAFGHGIVDALAAVGGPPAAPHPSPRVGADEPNDVPADATPLAVGVTHVAQIAPETDEDWYRVNFATTGWYSIHVPSSAQALDHELDPIVQLYKSDDSFTASQELVGGDLLFDISVAGDYLVRVRNVNGSTAPYTIVVRPTVAPPTFAPSIDVNFGTTAKSVAIADVNGDGRKDALLAFGSTSQLPDTIAVFAQTPTRSLDLFVALASDPMTGAGMATGDLDGDGRDDIAIPVVGGFDYFENLSAMSTKNFVANPGVTNSLSIADVDGDSHNDIVAVGSAGARVYWGPLFNSSTVLPGVSTAATAAIGDVSGHGNGLLDVVTCCVGVSRQTGFRTFAASSSLTSGTTGVAVGDISSDGAADVVASVRSSNGSLTRLVQDGSGGFLAPASSAVGAKPDPIAVADIDGDGANDIVVLHDVVSSGLFSLPTTVGWLRQTAPSVFASEQTFSIDDFSASYDAKALAVGDLEGDSRADILVATQNGISLLVQNSGLLPSLGHAWLVDAQPSSLATNVGSGVVPTLTLGRDVTNVDGTTVQLRDAQGNAVPAAVGYNGATHTVTITPNAALPDGRYAIHVAGLTDTGGETLDDAGTTFSVGPVLDETPPQTTLHSPPAGFRSTPSATLTFTSNEGGSTFWCSYDNQPYHACTSSQHVTATVGKHSFGVFARDPAGNEDASPAVAGWTYRPPVHGYWMLGGAGAIYAFGNAPVLGAASTSRAVDLDVSPSGYGYWVVDALGRVFAFGDARSHGNAPALASGDTVTSISRTASGNGYWLFTARGRVYTFGDAHFYGDMRNTRLNAPMLDSVRTPSGHGYYVVAADGGVFSFGDARFRGSTGGMHLNAPVRSLVPDPDGAGYWLVAVDGGVFSFAAPFRGSMGSTHLNRPVVGMVAFGNGYLMVGADGGIFNFSAKPFFGSLGSNPPSIPIVSVAAVG